MVFTKKASEIAQASKKQPRFKRRFGLSRFPVLMALVLSLIIFSCTHTSVSNSSSSTQSANDSGALKIWWDKGLNQQEDEALQQLVSNWEKQTGNKVKLSFYVNTESKISQQRN